MRSLTAYFVLAAACLLASCGGRNAAKPVDAATVIDSAAVATTETIAEPTLPTLSKTAQRLDSLGYVNLAELDSTLVINVVYATPDNFTGKVLYDDLKEAYLLPEAADKLLRAHRLLKEKHPEYRFIVYDAARPMSVQRVMYQTAKQRGMPTGYVANPANGGGLHNYGAAVDLSIVDKNGEPLPMGTEFDFFGMEANIDREQQLVKQGKLTEQELANRLLLRSVMRQAGFTTVSSEWWHFNHCRRNVAIEKYQLIE